MLVVDAATVLVNGYPRHISGLRVSPAYGDKGTQKLRDLIRCGTVTSERRGADVAIMVTPKGHRFRFSVAPVMVGAGAAHGEGDLAVLEEVARRHGRGMYAR